MSTSPQLLRDTNLELKKPARVLGEQNNEVWKLCDYNGDGILDLVYIKTSNTGTVPNLLK